MRHWMTATVICLVVPLMGKPSGANNLACLKEIELPQFAVARLVPTGGNVDAEVTVRPDGQVAGVKLSEANPSLLAEVEHHLRKKALYDGGCADKLIKLHFTFTVEGRPTHYPFTRVRFRPPNHFVITTQPDLPTVDYFPTEPPHGKQPSGR